MPDRESSERKGPWARGLVAVAVIAGAVAIAWLGSRLGWFPTTSPTRVVVLYCFSTLDDVMQERLLPAFREQWRSERGEEVEFVVTFAGSGDITKRILGEYPADVAIVSSELDAYRLPAPWQAWRALPHGGVLARTPLVIVTRPGNPRGIQSFEDLAGEGVALLHADPATSGAAELAVVAEYGAALRRGLDGEPAVEQLAAIWRNVAARPATAREARTRFERGEGDALVTYAADVVGSPSRPQIQGEIVAPVATILAEPVVVKIEKNIDAGQRRVVEAFVAFLWSPEAQQSLGEYGFLRADAAGDAAVLELPGIEDLFTLADLGGAGARAQILEAVWKNRVVPSLGR